MERQKINLDDPEDYCLSVGTVRTSEGIVYCGSVNYYDEIEGTRNCLTAHFHMDLSPSEVFYGDSIGNWHLQKHPCSRESWEKQKKLRKAMDGWYDANMSASLWDYTQKYEFYVKEGGFLWDLTPLYGSRWSPDFDKPTGSVIIPEPDEMQYDEAFGYAWKEFREDKSYPGDQEIVAISSICIRITPEEVQRIQESLPDFPDDGVVWDFLFYLPMDLDNGETLYHLIYYSGRIYRAQTD